MASTPFPNLLLDYLTTLRDTATQEIKARKPVELEAQDTPEVVPQLIDVTVSPLATMSGSTPQPSDDPVSHLLFASLAEAFVHHTGRLLLLGRPGAGKTTTLWMFARECTDACLADPKLPLPIFLKIDTWNRKTPLEDWLRSQMPGLPLQNQPLLYLCDGLDELGAERPVDPANPEGERFDPRADFLRLAEEQMQGSQFVISCRIAEYQQIRSKMHGCGAVTLMPLDEEKIEEFLTSWDRPRLWEALLNDSNLMELARTPLLLSLLCSAVGTEEIDTEQALNHLNESTLFGFYFNQRFVHEERKFQTNSPGQDLPFDKATTQKLLGRLAHYMWQWLYDPLTTLDRIEARFHLGEQTDAFLAFAYRMNFLRASPDGHIAFIHLKFRDFCAVSALQQALEEGSSQIRYHAVLVLKMLKEMGLLALVQALNHSVPEVRYAAIDGLPRWLYDYDPAFIPVLKQSVPSLLQTLHSDDTAMRYPAAELLMPLGIDATPALLQELQTNDLGLRCTVAVAFSCSHVATDPALHEVLTLAVSTLVEGLTEGEKDIREQAASGLAVLASDVDPAPSEKLSPLARAKLIILNDSGSEELEKPEATGTLPDPQTVQRLSERLRQAIPALVEALKYGDESFWSNDFPLKVMSALISLRDYFLPDLLPALRNSDRKVRSAAVKILMRSKKQTDPMVQETLMASVSAALRDLQSGEIGLQRAAIWDLSHFVPLLEKVDAEFREMFKQAVPTLFEALHVQEKEARREAAGALFALDVPVVPALLQALTDRDVRERRRAAARFVDLISHRYNNMMLPDYLAYSDRTLTPLTDAGVSHFDAALIRAFSALLQALQDRDTRVRKVILSVLAQLSEVPCLMAQEALPDAAPILRQALQHRDYRVRRTAAFLLAQSGDLSNLALQDALPQILSELLQAIQSEDERVRFRAGSYIISLGRNADASYQKAFLQAVPALLRSLTAKKVSIQSEATWLIFHAGPQVIPALRHALHASDSRMRCLAVSALTDIGRQTDPDYLRLSGDQEGPAYRAAFEQTIPDLVAALQDRNAAVRREAIIPLFCIREQAIPTLRQALRDRNRKVQETVNFVFREEPRMIPVLLQALQENHVVVRRNAADTLRYFRIPVEIPPDPPIFDTALQTTPILLQALRDRDARVRKGIISVLRWVEAPIDPALLGMLKEEAFALRDAAVQILENRKTAIPSLLHLLQSDHRAARWAALAALYEHGYAPRLALRPRPHVKLHYTFAFKKSAIIGRILRLQMRVALLHGIPIQFSEAGA